MITTHPQADTIFYVALLGKLATMHERGRTCIPMGDTSDPDRRQPTRAVRTDCKPHAARTQTTACQHSCPSLFRREGM